MYKTMHKGNLDIYGQEKSGRMLFAQGMVIDPLNGLHACRDILVENGCISEVAETIEEKKGDIVIDCKGLQIWPGLIDMHLHISDLYEIHTNTAYTAAQDGVTTGLSPGAGNTFMTPALLGAEMDRGLPINTGVFLGAANVLSSMLTEEELIQLFCGKLSDAVKEQKMTRNWITNDTAMYTVGIKEHMGHCLLPDEAIKKAARIAQQSQMLFMSHTQDVAHTERILQLTQGMSVHLGHANAVGCTTYGDPVDSMKRIVACLKEDRVTGEFVTSMLRKGLGGREGILTDRWARDVALQALSDKVVEILVSDGQNQSTMKGFGDTRDNIPCILELIEEKVLSPLDAVATMTSNPAQLLFERTGNEDWKRYGNLAKGSYANITIVDIDDRMASYVITNGRITSFENRFLRSSGQAGYWVSKFGTRKNMGVGQLPLYKMN
ncbi:MAG: amidohydrolase family protein [Lachnospiraceae bacterium]